MLINQIFQAEKMICHLSFLWQLVMLYASKISSHEELAQLHDTGDTIDDI